MNCPECGHPVTATDHGRIKCYECHRCQMLWPASYLDESCTCPPGPGGEAPAEPDRRCPVHGEKGANDTADSCPSATVRGAEGGRN